MRRSGLLLQSHDGSDRLDLPVVEHPSEIRFLSDDLVLLAVKTQDTIAALDDLAPCAPPDIAIACAQNGVEGERIALRRFARVYGVSVMCPAMFLEPGQVQAFGTPVTGILDVGRYPSGTDELSARLAETFRAARFDSKVRDQILRFKYGKLLFNLGNAIEAVCGPAARQGPIGELVKREAIAALTSAGVAFDACGRCGRSTHRLHVERAMHTPSTNLFLAIGLALSVVVPAVCRAQTVVVPIAAAPEEGTFSSGDQYYEADLSGFRDYLESIRSEEPALYGTLDAELDGIETRRTLAHVLIWGVGVGGGAALLGLAFLLHDDCGAGDDRSPISQSEARERERCGDSADTQDLALLGSSIALFAGGLISGLVLIPGRPTFLRMVNQHNRLSPHAPLRVGLSATSRHAYARLIVSF